MFYHQAYTVNLSGKIDDKTTKFLTGVNDAFTDAVPDYDEGVYAGYIDPALGENSTSLYWSGNVERLESIKVQVDPDDVFHNPQSIRPAKGSVKLRVRV